VENVIISAKACPPPATDKERLREAQADVMLIAGMVHKALSESRENRSE
jgi:hypothetical protein